jgi:hypothetical protein
MVAEGADHRVIWSSGHRVIATPRRRYSTSNSQLVSSILAIYHMWKRTNLSWARKTGSNAGLGFLWQA